LGALLLLLSAAGAGAQTIDLTDLKTDVNTVFTSMGRDIAPRLHQIALSGNELVGESLLHGVTRFYVGFGAAVTTIDGVASVLASEDEDDWEYKTLPLSKLVKDSFASGSTGDDVFGLVTERTFPMPSPRIVFGFPLPFRMEFQGNLFYLPSGLADMAKDAAGGSVDFEEMDTTAEILTIGGVLRRNILSDTKTFWRPAVSLGVGYTYSHFKMGFGSFSFDAMGMDELPDVGMGVLDMAGEMGFETKVHSVGAVVGISKTLVKVFVPYAKAAAYYHAATYESQFKADATIYQTDADGNIEEPRVITEQIDIDAPVKIESADLSILFSTGMEIRLLPVTLLFGVSMDLERPVAEIKDFSLTGFTLNGVGAAFSLRIQI
jgi:hypothetical protein